LKFFDTSAGFNTLLVLLYQGYISKVLGNFLRLHIINTMNLFIEQTCHERSEFKSELDGCLNSTPHGDVLTWLSNIAIHCGGQGRKKTSMDLGV
jgi:hypothetical protein